MPHFVPLLQLANTDLANLSKVIFTWTGLLALLWLAAIQPWYFAVIDGATYTASGLQGGESIIVLLLINLLALLLIIFLRRRVFLTLVTAVSIGVAGFAIVQAVIGQLPVAVYRDIASSAATSDQFEPQAYPIRWLSILIVVLIILVQIWCTIAINKSPRNSKPSKYDLKANRDPDDPIAIWDSQA